MTTSCSDTEFVRLALARQGIALPPERTEAVAAAAVRLAETAHTLENRLSFNDDLHGFLTMLSAWTDRR